VSWSLENAGQPVLERARERLLTLDAADPRRVIRLVVRRCKLNLIEVQPERVVAHHWGQQGRADVRPFFKKHSLAKQGVEVFLIGRKREVVAARPGDDFLYGERLTEAFPLGVYLEKWRRRRSKSRTTRRPPRAAAPIIAGRGSSHAGFPGGC
jgi:hypothetical protein